MKTKSIICRGRVRAIEDAIEAWKADHDDAMEARDGEDVVRECLWVRDLLQEWHRQVWAALFENRLSRIQQTGEMLGTALEKTLAVFNEVRRLIHLTEMKGYQVDNSSDFNVATQQLEQLRGDLLKRWPFMDAEQVRAGRADVAAGRYQPAEEILRELQGTDLGPR